MDNDTAAKRSKEIDWTKFGPISQTIECYCDTSFRTHAKFDMKTNAMISMDPCPKCGSFFSFRRIAGDPEVW